MERKIPISGYITPRDRELYVPGGCSRDQRLWIRERDNDKCQFHEMDNGRFVVCGRIYSPHSRLEVHHIRPQGLQKLDPKPHGGETPYNLITLCEDHHNIMAPHMLAAKETYKYDRDSFSRWIGFAHQAVEKGLMPYNQEFDGMLKQIARFRTDFYYKHIGPDPFPWRRRNGN